MQNELSEYNMHGYIGRAAEADLLQSLLRSPVTALLGPRQCGKSTLVRHILAQWPDAIHLDLELPSDQRRLAEPEFFLRENADRLVCIDEVQLHPELFPVVRALVDQDRRPGRYLVLGSASQDLIRQSSETLAGRIHYIELTPFLNSEIEAASEAEWDFRRLWWRGGFPPSFLAPDEAASSTWRRDLVQTFLSRDIPQFGFAIPAPVMHRFWQMLAHVHGSLFNASKIGQSLDCSHNTVRRYLDLLEQTFMVRVLRPLEVNLKKRLVKSPKIYVRDSGILHSLLEIDTFSQLCGHPLFGASWEGLCIEQIVAVLPEWRPRFYRTSNGAELDLVMERGGRKLAFEFKASLSPRLPKSFAGVINDIAPEQTWVVCPGLQEGYSLRPGVRVEGLSSCLQALTETFARK